MTTPLTPAEEVEEPLDAPETTGTERDTTEHVDHWEPEPEEGDEPDEEQELGEAAVEEQATEPVEEVVPVKVRAGGQEVTIEGALLAPEGMYVPKEHVAKVLQTLQRGKHHDLTWHQEMHRERMEVKRQDGLRQVSEAKASVYTAKMEDVFSSPEKFLAFADNLQPNLAMLQMEVNNAETAKRYELQKTGLNLEQPYNQLAGDDLRNAAAQSLVENYNSVVSLPEIRALLPDQAAENQVFALLMRTPNRYIQPAPQDIPEIGILKGQLVIDLEVLAADTKQLAQMRGPQLQVQKANEAKTDRAKQINKAVETATKAPPRAPAKPGAKKAAPVRGAAEWQRRLLRMAREV